MDNKNEEVTDYIRDRLSLLMLMAFKEYTKRVEQVFPDDCNGFVGAQSACRAALSHMILLHRFAERFPLRVGADLTKQDIEVEALIDEARADLSRR